MTTAQQVSAGAACLDWLSDKLDAIIYLLNTGSLTPAQIEAGAKCFWTIPDKWAAIVFLLNTSNLTTSQIAAGQACYCGVRRNLAPLVYLWNTNNLTGAAIASGAKCYTGLQDKLGCIVYLLNNGAKTVAQIIAGSKCYTDMADKQNAAVYLLANPAVTPPPVSNPVITLTGDLTVGYHFSAVSTTGYFTYVTSAPVVSTTVSSLALVDVPTNNPTVTLFASDSSGNQSGSLTEFYCGVGFGSNNPLASQGHILALNFGTVTTLTTIVCNDNGLTSLDVTAQTGLQQLWCGGTNNFTNGTLKVSNLPQLNLFWFWNQTNLTHFMFVGLPLVSSATNDPGALDQASIDSIFMSIDAGGLLNGGPVDFAGGTSAAPSAAGIAAFNNLIAKGWTSLNHN